MIIGERETTALSGSTVEFFLNLIDTSLTAISLCYGYPVRARPSTSGEPSIDHRPYYLVLGLREK